MKKKAKSLTQQISDAQVIITLAYTNDDARKRLEPYGYDEPRLKEGISLHKLADDLSYEQSQKYSQMQIEADHFRTARKAADAFYLPLLKIARIVLRTDAPAHQKLHLSGDREHGYSKWLTQVVQFYSGALETPEVLKKLNTRGITREKLEKGLALVHEVESLHLSKELKKGESIAATRRRDEAVKQLKRFVTELKAIDKIALKEHPGVPLPKL